MASITASSFVGNKLYNPATPPPVLSFFFAPHQSPVEFTIPALVGCGEGAVWESVGCVGGRWMGRFEEGLCVGGSERVGGDKMRVTATVYAATAYPTISNQPTSQHHPKPPTRHT